MPLRVVVFTFFLSVCSAQAHANPVANRYIPNAALVGEGRLTYLFWDVYDAALYAPKGIWSYEKPFALSLHYLRDLNGDAIAKRSIEEMKKQGFSNHTTLDKWYVEMKNIFPDVQKGTVLTGVFFPGRYTEFFEGTTSIGRVSGDSFIHAFAGIWLNAQTSEPSLRNKLLGK